MSFFESDRETYTSLIQNFQLVLLFVNPSYFYHLSTVRVLSDRRTFGLLRTISLFYFSAAPTYDEHVEALIPADGEGAEPDPWEPPPLRICGVHLNDEFVDAQRASLPLFRLRNLSSSFLLGSGQSCSVLVLLHLVFLVLRWAYLRTTGDDTPHERGTQRTSRRPARRSRTVICDIHRLFALRSSSLLSVLHTQLLFNFSLQFFLQVREFRADALAFLSLALAAAALLEYFLFYRYLLRSADGVQSAGSSRELALLLQAAESYLETYRFSPRVQLHDRRRPLGGFSGTYARVARNFHLFGVLKAFLFAALTVLLHDYPVPQISFQVVLNLLLLLAVLIVRPHLNLFQLLIRVLFEVSQATLGILLLVAHRTTSLMLTGETLTVGQLSEVAGVFVLMRLLIILVLLLQVLRFLLDLLVQLTQALKRSLYPSFQPAYTATVRVSADLPARLQRVLRPPDTRRRDKSKAHFEMELISQASHLQQQTSYAYLIEGISSPYPRTRRLMHRMAPVNSKEAESLFREYLLALKPIAAVRNSARLSFELSALVGRANPPLLGVL